MSAAFDIERIPPGARLELYTKPGCPYCAQAMAHYRRVGTPFSEHDAQEVTQRLLPLSGDVCSDAAAADERATRRGASREPRSPFASLYHC